MFRQVNLNYSLFLIHLTPSSQYSIYYLAKPSFDVEKVCEFSYVFQNIYIADFENRIYRFHTDEFRLAYFTTGSVRLDCASSFGKNQSSFH